MALNIWQGPGSSTTTTAWNTGTNWSTGSANTDGDTAYLEDSSVGVAAYDDSAHTLARLVQDQTYTGQVGSATDFLKVGATVFDLGLLAVGGGTGSPRMNIWAANSGAIINVFSTGQSATDSGMTPTRLLGTSLVLNCSGGKTGVALLESETASIATLNMTKGASVPTVTLGVGVTTTTANVSAGTVLNYSSNAIATINLSNNSTFTHLGTGAVGSTAANVGSGATLDYRGTGTITLLELAGTFDLSKGAGAVTVTNANLYEGAQIIDPLGRLTFTNPFKTKQCKLGDVTVDLGFNRNYQVS